MTTAEGAAAALPSPRPAPGIGARELLVMISTIMALTAVGIDMLLPAFDNIEQAFEIDPSSSDVSLVLTTFFLGLAVSQIFWGPLADRYGRKPVLYAGITIYTAGAIGSALAPSLAWLLFGRFIWGVGAAGARVVAVAIIRDSFEGVRMAKAMSQIMAVFVLVPVFAPSVGAWLMDLFNWKAIFWFAILAALTTAVWSTRLNETLDPADRRPLALRSVGSGFATVFRTRITAGYTLATVFLQATFAAYLGSSERMISDIFDRGDQFAVIFGAVAVLFGIAALVNGQVVGIFGIRRLIHVMLAAVTAVGVGLIVLSVGSNGSPAFWIFMPVLGLLLSMFMFLMPNLNTAALEPMGELAGTASALTGAVRVGAGGLLGAVVDSQVRDTTTPFASAIVIFAVCAAVSVVWGERSETRSDQLGQRPIP